MSALLGLVSLVCGAPTQYPGGADVEKPFGGFLQLAPVPVPAAPAQDAATEDPPPNPIFQQKFGMTKEEYEAKMKAVPPLGDLKVFQYGVTPDLPPIDVTAGDKEKGAERDLFFKFATPTPWPPWPGYGNLTCSNPDECRKMYECSLKPGYVYDRATGHCGPPVPLPPPDPPEESPVSQLKDRKGAISSKHDCMEPLGAADAPPKVIPAVDPPKPTPSGVVQGEPVDDLSKKPEDFRLPPGNNPCSLKNREDGQGKECFSMDVSDGAAPAVAMPEKGIDMSGSH